MGLGLNDNPLQKMICVDKGGKATGETVNRKTAHSTPGKKHLAIQILVFTPSNELILHERPLEKVGGGVWDAPTTHVLYGETSEEAAERCLSAEYGIKGADVTVLKGFSYEKDYGDGSCENEYCLAAFTVFTGKIKPGKEHVGKIVNVPAKQVAKERESRKYPVWFVETVKLVMKDSEGKKFF